MPKMNNDIANPKICNKLPILYPRVKKIVSLTHNHSSTTLTFLVVLSAMFDLQNLLGLLLLLLGFYFRLLDEGKGRDPSLEICRTVLIFK